MCISGSENIYDFIQLIITASMSHIYVNKKGYSNYRKSIHYNSFKNSSIFQFGMKYSFINKRYTYLLLIFSFRTYYFLVYITLWYRHNKLLYITQIFTNVIILVPHSWNYFFSNNYYSFAIFNIGFFIQLYMYR